MTGCKPAVHDQMEGIVDYIWELFLSGDQDDIRLTQADAASPYYELGPEELRQEEPGVAAYNAMCRYGAIFEPMLSKEHADGELDACFFDMISRFLIHVDLKEGLSVPEYRRRKTIEALLSGICGDRVRVLYAQLPPEKRYRIAVYVCTMDDGEPSVFLFGKALVDLLDTGALYQDKEDPDFLILYVGRKKNEADLLVIELIQALLLPVGRRLKIMWETHFGIVNEKETMRYDAIEIL